MKSSFFGGGSVTAAVLRLTSHMMKTLQHAIKEFDARACGLGLNILRDSNHKQPFRILAGDDQTGLRLTWDLNECQLVIEVTYGADGTCSDWLDLYDMPIPDPNNLPDDHGISIADAIDYGIELMTPYSTPT